MPNIDGRQLVRIMSQYPPYSEVPIVIVSGSEFEDLKELPGVVACFPKPIPFDDVRVCIENLLLSMGQEKPTSAQTGAGG